MTSSLTDTRSRLSTLAARGAALSFVGLVTTSCATVASSSAPRSPDGEELDEERAWRAVVEGSVRTLRCPEENIVVQPMALSDSDARTGARRVYRVTGCAGVANILVFGPCTGEDDCRTRAAPPSSQAPIHENQREHDVEIP